MFEFEVSLRIVLFTVTLSSVCRQNQCRFFIIAILKNLKLTVKERPDVDDGQIHSLPV